MTETDSFLAEVLDKQRAAEQALHRGDPEPRMALWSRGDPVTLFGARVSGSGWADLEPVFRQVASWFTDLVEWEFEVVAAGASGGLAYTVGYERSRITVEGVPGTHTLRVTHVYRREGSEWRIVHRHADFPPDPDAPVIPR